MGYSKRIYRHRKVLHEAFVARFYDQEQTPALGQQRWILDGNQPNMRHACDPMYKNTGKSYIIYRCESSWGITCSELEVSLSKFHQQFP